ncbi:MAG: HD domain-containing phosphohydrolase [Elusimicrobiota bacterium]|nr:HD domain-containing phosphohydrolase [Elusimicrobiota bacterium]
MNEELKQLRKEKERMQSLLDFGHEVSSRIMDLDELLKLIMGETRNILNAERCTVFLRDFDTDTLYSKIADGLGLREIRIPMEKGIAGAVARSGETMNIKDAYSDDRFDTSTDKKTGYITKTILSCPMKNKMGESIGVFQVLNKKDGVFDGEDEKILLLLARQAADAVENAFLYDEQKKMFESFIDTLSDTLDKRDYLTAGHSRRVTFFSIKTGEAMKLFPHELELLKYSSWMHDMGKIGVREHILAKAGKLTDEEFEQIKNHAVFTREILEKIYFKREFRQIPEIAASHHENIDGSGYPRGLKGAAIPFFSRIIAVCDVFDALTSKRHYREPMPIAGVLKILKDGVGVKFDPVCVDAFFKMNLLDVVTGINLEKVENFVIVSEDEEALKKYNLEDFYRVVSCVEYTPAQSRIIEVFAKYYGK